jgi:phosphohistidine phosphatase SixA
MKFQLRKSLGLILISIVVLSCGLTAAQEKELSGSALVAALRKGGYVMVLRHTSSPRETPTKQTANPDNVKLERQLDEMGREGATAMGNALRSLRIPIGDVLSSPTYRTQETVKYAKLGNPDLHAELGDRGQSMQGVSESDGAWLREQSGKVPKTGNTVIVTHMPNISRAFPQVTGVSDGETLIFRPDGKGGSVLTGRIRIEQWPLLKP